MNLKSISIYAPICFLTMSCESKSKRLTREDVATTQMVMEKPIDFKSPAPVSAVVVKQGMLPLVYFNESNSSLVIDDMTSGARLATVIAEPRQIISIDAEHGVTIGERVVTRGPLPEADRYSISLAPATGGTIRTTTIKSPAETQLQSR